MFVIIIRNNKMKKNVSILKYWNEFNFIKCCLTSFYIKLKQEHIISWSWIVFKPPSPLPITSRWRRLRKLSFFKKILSSPWCSFYHNFYKRKKVDWIPLTFYNCVKDIFHNPMSDLLSMKDLKKFKSVVFIISIISISISKYLHMGLSY